MYACVNQIICVFDDRLLTTIAWLQSGESKLPNIMMANDFETIAIFCN